MVARTQPVIRIENPNSGYIWQPQPFNIWLGTARHCPLQEYIYKKLRERLEEFGCRFVNSPLDLTPIGNGAQLGIVFGKDLDEEISPLTLLGQLPKPRGMMLIINTIEQIPDEGFFDMARGQLVKKAGHISIMAEGDLNGETVARALWGSMPGNNRMLEGDEADIFDGLALRIMAHVGAEKVNRNEGERVMGATWEQWGRSPIHADLAAAAAELGKAGIVEDEIPLAKYATGEQTRSVLRFLQRAALGEGMRSQIDLELRVMGVSTSGGNKVNVSANPLDGHTIPISHLSWNGYYVDIPEGCPITYTPPSVETHENGLVYLASALVSAGLVNSFEGFLAYLSDHFSQHDAIAIVPEGMHPVFTAIEHFHRQPRQGSIREPERVEIVYPDPNRFPEIDFPCGVREAELHLLSAFFVSRTFLDPAPPPDRVVIAVLPGHGSVALYGGPHHELIDLLVCGMEMEEIARI